MQQIVCPVCGKDALYITDMFETADKKYEHALTACTISNDELRKRGQGNGGSVGGGSKLWEFPECAKESYKMDKVGTPGMYFESALPYINPENPKNPDQFVSIEYHNAMSKHHIGTIRELQQKLLDAMKENGELKEALRLSAASVHGSWCNQPEWPGDKTRTMHDCKEEAEAEHNTIWKWRGKAHE